MRSRKCAARYRMRENVECKTKKGTICMAYISRSLLFMYRFRDQFVIDWENDSLVNDSTILYAQLFYIQFSAKKQEKNFVK